LFELPALTLSQRVKLASSLSSLRTPPLRILISRFILSPTLFLAPSPHFFLRLFDGRQIPPGPPISIGVPPPAFQSSRSRSSRNAPSSPFFPLKCHSASIRTHFLFTDHHLSSPRYRPPLPAGPPSPFSVPPYPPNL